MACNNKMLKVCTTITQVIQLVTLKTQGVDLTNVFAQLITRASVKTKANAHNKPLYQPMSTDGADLLKNQPDVGTTWTNQIGLT